jgi:lysophospholipase L1-like esterase
MIEHQGVGLHNVMELEPAPGGGVFLRRFPRSVREAMSPLGRMVAQESAGCELRFVTDAASFRLTLGSLPSVLGPWELHNQDVFILRGGFVHSHHRIRPGQLNHINVLNIAGTDAFAGIQPATARRCGFAPQVWRVLLGRYPAVFHELDTYGYDRRPPRGEEVPAITWLAYGSSITHGASPTVHLNAYLYHAARVAGVNVINQGLSGSCLCEPQVADYLAGREDWQVITLELGVNMRTSFTPDEFAQRATHLVEQLRQRRPDGRLVLITIYPNSASAGITAQPDGQNAQRELAFNDTLRQIVAQRRDPMISLVEGRDILTELDTTVDLVHPSDYGHARMGEQLGQRLKSILTGRDPGAGDRATPRRR